MTNAKEIQKLYYGDLVDICEENGVEVKAEDDRESLIKKLESVKLTEPKDE